MLEGSTPRAGRQAETRKPSQDEDIMIPTLTSGYHDRLSYSLPEWPEMLAGMRPKPSHCGRPARGPFRAPPPPSGALAPRRAERRRVPWLSVPQSVCAQAQAQTRLPSDAKAVVHARGADALRRSSAGNVRGPRISSPYLAATAAICAGLGGALGGAGIVSARSRFARRRASRDPLGQAALRGCALVARSSDAALARMPVARARGAHRLGQDALDLRREVRLSRHVRVVAFRQRVGLSVQPLR
jgi:hypothetical protein